MSSTTSSDWELAKQFASGCGESFEELVCRYEGRVFWLASLWSGEASTAERILSDVFLRVYREIGELHPERQISSWIFSCLVDRILYEKGAPNSPCLLVEKSSVDGSTMDESSKFAMILAKLPEEYKIVMFLREMLGLSLKECSEVLDLQLSDIIARLHRARLMLRRHYRAQKDLQQGEQEQAPEEILPASTESSDRNDQKLLN